MYVRSRFEDLLTLITGVIAVCGFGLVFLGLTTPGSGLRLQSPAYAAAHHAASGSGLGTGTARPRTFTASRVIVPALGVDSELRPIDLDADRVLTPPADPEDLGWWRQSAAPGRPGRTVVAGHTVHTGGGALDHLGRLARGDLVRLVTDGRTLDYRVVRVQVLSTAKVTAQARSLFGQHRTGSSLLLVTCTGWTGTHYTGNVFVTAVPVDPGSDTGSNAWSGTAA